MLRFHVIGFVDGNIASVRTFSARNPATAARLYLEQYVVKTSPFPRHYVKRMHGSGYLEQYDDRGIAPLSIDLEVFRWNRHDPAFPGEDPIWDPEHVSRVKEGRDSTCYHGTKYADGTHDLEAVV